MCGKETDFDPDALVQNAVYALCGPYRSVALASPAQEAPASIIMASVMCDDGGEHAAAKKHPCPVCGKRLRLVGMQDHIRDAHALG